ncbi:MAG: 30S ribosomal protein S6 [Candidatus Marinimicrobia bacterium]|nr:30S ribosomal protein S6 [Candidatus Neomarinimicrobiota bacterium]
MRYYETVYIINPNFEQSRLDIIIKEIEQHLGEFSKIISHNMWGKKKLAYQINGQKYGAFVLLHFESDNSNRISDFESFMKLNSSVLRAQTIRLKSKPSASILEKNITIELKDESDGVIEKESSTETKNTEDSTEEVDANTEGETEDSTEEESDLDSK